MIRPISTNPFVGTPAATLANIQATYTQALLDIATTGVSYSVPGRSFTAANLDDIKDTLAEINAAISYAAGNSFTKAAPRLYPYGSNC